MLGKVTGVIPVPTQRPMDSRAQTRLANRLVISGFAIVLAMMWCAIGYYIVQSRDERIAEEQRVLVRMAGAVQQRTHALFSLLDYFLVSADLYFDQHPEADPRTDPGFLELVSAFRERTDHRVDIRFVSTDGRLYYLGDQSDEPRAYVSDRDYFRVQLPGGEPQGVFVGKPVISRVNGRWILPISYPLHAKPHGMAVIFAAIENHLLVPSFNEARTKPNGTTLLAHRDGTLLLRAPETDAIGTSLARTPAWLEHTSGELEGTFRTTASPLDGIPRVGAFTVVPGYPLVVVVTSAIPDILATWQLRSLGLSLFGFIASLVGIGMLARMTRFMDDLALTRQKLEQQAYIDDLTQIANRRRFFEQGKVELERARRYERPLSLLMIDIDHFKAINDAIGHEGGDHVLKAVADALQIELRTADTIGRLGGEEFAVLLPETDLATALAIAERLRAGIERLAIDAAPVAQTVTASFGVSTFMGEETTLDRLLARADRGLYRAKRAGRNLVVTEDEPPPPDPDDTGSQP